MINTQQDLFEQPFSFELNGDNGAVTVSLEKEVINKEETATGRFIIDHEHISGKYQYFLEPDLDENWEASGACPDFLDQEIIDFIGGHIQDHYEEMREN